MSVIDLATRQWRVNNIAVGFVCSPFVLLHKPPDRSNNGPELLGAPLVDVRPYNGAMDTAAASPNDRLRRVIEDQPDDSSFEEILTELAFAATVERGLADSRAGRTISHEEMRKTLESWRT